MNNTYVIGDIHGGLQALLQILKKAQITTSDRLIFLGDYVDGWSETPQLLDYLIQLDKQYECIFLQGNHEEMVLRWLRDDDDDEMWRFHGGQVTVDQYKTSSELTKKNHIEFLSKLKKFHIDEDNRLYVHAGFTSQKGVSHEYFEGMFWWDRSLWETAMCLDPNIDKDDVRYPKRLLLYNEIFIGHTPTIRFGSAYPMNFANVWNIDTGAAFTGVLTAMNVKTKEFWQSDALPSLYPNEKGRNL